MKPKINTLNNFRYYSWVYIPVKIRILLAINDIDFFSDIKDDLINEVNYSTTQKFYT